MNSKLFIAEKVKVGFNPRPDTYSGKLGYVIGFDGKKWRKEPSWDGWRYHYMDDAEYQQKRREQYNDNITYQKKNYAQNVSFYTQDPNKNSYYKQYADMTEDEYLSRYLGPYEKFTPNLGRVSSDEGLKPLEFDNVPTEGFVLNKKVGGYSNGWDHRSTYCRVYDPRGFEFEITVPNLLFILQECNAYKGKGLEGEFVYAWDGKDLVLLPASSADYQESQKFTKLQSGKVSTKDLVEGCVYKMKNMEEFIYLGKFNWFNEGYNNDITVKKSYVFHMVKKPAYGNSLMSVTGLANFVQRVTDVPVSNYAELLDIFNKSKYSGQLTDIEEVAYSPQKSTSSYYGRNKDFLGMPVLPLGENKYEIYEVEAAEVSRDIRGYSYNYEFKSYNLKANKVLHIKPDGDFEIKALKLKTLEKLSHKAVVDMKLKELKLTKNKKKINF